MQSIAQLIATISYWLKFWEWPGRIMKLIDQWHAMRESAHRARREKLEADAAEASHGNVLFEAKVDDMIRKLRKHYNDTAAKYPAQHVHPIIQPSPDDDLEVFNEAMRRVKLEFRDPR